MILSRAPFPVARLHFTARMEAAFPWPEFPGSMLRGAFGAALRRLSCMTGMRSCIGCPLIESCPYPLLFEPPAQHLGAVGIGRKQSGLTPPFALDLTEDALFSGPDLQFSMRLFGRPAIERLALVVEAWRRALSHGLGRGRIQGQLLSVSEALPHGGQLLWSGGDLAPATLVRPALVMTGADIVIRTRTPLRLKANNALMQQQGPGPRRLVAAIVRRARLLAAGCDDDARNEVSVWPVGAWLEAADDIVHASQMAWQPVYRFSARQRRRMDMGGLVGEWRWTGVPPAIQALLALATEMHIGKEAGFGLGALHMGKAA